MAFDLFIRGGTVVSPQGRTRAHVAVQDGRIAAITLEEHEAHRVIDAEGKYVLPGVIDPHGHFASRRTFEESCLIETRRMAAGGVTSYLDFLQAKDGSYIPRVEQARKFIEQHSVIDMGLHAIVMTRQHVQELAAYVKLGVISFKFYMAARGAELYPNTLSVDDGLLYEGLEAIARLGPPALAMVHAENWEIAWALSDRLKAAGRTDAAAWSEGKPGLCEEDAMRRATYLAWKLGCPLYIVHIGIGTCREILREARGWGATVYGETCPHYLMVHKDHPMARIAKYNPAIKLAQDNAGLWEALAEGTIQCLGSDHIPGDRVHKFPPGKDGSIWDAVGGVPGSPTILPLMLHGVSTGRLTLERVVEVTSANAARILGLYPRKGAIAIGADADLVVVDLSRRVRFRPELLLSEFSIFDGFEFQGWPVMTILRGTVIMEEGEVVGKNGSGRYLHRPLGAAT
ncbi:MAG: amidohydrolase family protein [Deltaproteobacteria bacterium]|nr:amidohydrolase family protein [Deltaproteobacteria bacterium]